ncbi:carbohydrate porin, partial [Pseudanabaenaceae cyanobacterium LEGE 13415]|nr:carbohydrate porin [Pseudanabaenaceae cyanobacterium LEGE 13415]
PLPNLDRPVPTPEFNSVQEPDGLEQVTSVSQLSDVQPTDWAFQALQSLVEQYGCIAGFPDRTFRGNRALTRYEFAAGLNACLDRVQELINAQRSNTVTQQDLDTLQKLQAEFSTELAEVKGRVDSLEARTATLEKNQFLTTTRLFGQAIVSTQLSNKTDVDLFPRDGIPERQAEAKPTLTNNVQISLATSFSGRDLLLTTLQTGNLRSNAPNLFTNMGRLSFESEQENQIFISDLSYRFPVADNFGVLIGASGVNPSNVFRGINPLEGSGEGTLSLLGQRNPILAIGNGIGGIGFDWQINQRLSFQGVYSAELPGFTGNSNFGGLIGGQYTAGAQLTIAPTNTINIGIHYLFSRSLDGFLGTGIGDSQLLSPFAPMNSAFTTHAIGGTLAWRLNPKITIGGWGGWTSSKAIDVSGSVQTTNWMLFSAFPDLFVPGNLGGLLFGQPPKITASTLPDGYNFPRFSDTGSRGGQPDTALHLEAFYRARLNSFLDITPGVLVIFNANHNAANDEIVVGAVRATFRF